jgi:hypothetical protein
MTDENTSGFTAAEEAYFASGGDESTLEAETGTEVTDQPSGVDLTQPAQEQSDQQERDDKGRFVPHGALHAEREEHKKTKAALEEIQRNQAILNDRWNTLLATGKPQQEQPKEETPPDPAVDIIAYMQWQADKTKQLNEKMAAEERQRQEAAQHQQQEQIIWSTWESSVNQAKTAIPDFDAATGFLAQLRDSQLQAFSSVDPSFSDPQARVAQINAELRQIIVQAKNAGQDPAAAVYQIAKGYGYTLSEAAPDSNKIDKIIQAQAGSKTIAGTNGNAMADPLSAQAILDMPAAEFDAWVQSPANAKRFEKMLQGV